MQNKKIKYFKIIMMAINLIAVFFVTIFIYLTTRRICDYYSAREFISSVKSLPLRPFDIVLMSIGLFCILILSFAVREFLYPNSSRILYLSLVVDFIVIIAVIYILNFNYNGILFLLFASIITNTKGVKGRYVLMLLAIASFLIADYDLIAINFRLYSLNDYIGYYDSIYQQYLLGFYNILVSVNIIVFILYCINVVRDQRVTIDEVNALYEELSKVNKDLENANIQLQEYSTITEKMGETRERNRLAREIHDTLGHTLTGISAALDACITTVEKSPGETKRQLEVISNVTREGIMEVRRSVRQLRPDALERLTLEHAITKMITDLNSVTNTKIFFDSGKVKLKFAADEEDAIYRVIQESITNAMRHGKASKVWVRIREAGGEIVLTIKDNGAGCKKIEKGFGTRHIEERIDLLNGKVELDGTDGFTVTVKIPIRWGEEYD